YPLRGRQGDIPPPARLFNRKTGVPPATAARTPCSSCENLFARPEKSRKILPLVFEYSNTFGSIPAQGLLLAAGRQSFFTPPLSSARSFLFSTARNQWSAPDRRIPHSRAEPARIPERNTSLIRPLPRAPHATADRTAPQ